MLFGFGRRSRRTGKTRRSAPFARRRRRLVEDRPESHRARGRDVRRRRRAGRRRDRRREHDAHEQTGGLRAAHVVRQVETGLPDRPVGLRGRIHAWVHPPLLPQGHRSHERGAGAAARLHAEKGEQRPPHYDRVGRHAYPQPGDDQDHIVGHAVDLSPEGRTGLHDVPPHLPQGAARLRQSPARRRAGLRHESGRHDAGVALDQRQQGDAGQFRQRLRTRGHADPDLPRHRQPRPRHGRAEHRRRRRFGGRTGLYLRARADILRRQHRQGALRRVRQYAVCQHRRRPVVRRPPQPASDGLGAEGRRLHARRTSSAS